MKDNNKILVSIINWNDSQATSDCLESISKIEAKNQPDIRLIDNASEAEPFKIPSSITKKLKSYDEVLNKTNLGFAKAHNQSLKFAVENGYDYACLLNNDTELTDRNIFTKLVEAFEENTLAVAPAILDADGNIWYGGGSFNKFTSTPSHNRVGQPPKKLGTKTETDHITGCCVMISVKALKESGLYLPEEYFMYWEDAEWSLKARKANYKIIYEPATAITHKVSSSLGIKSPTYIYYIIRNNILFIKRNTPLIHRPLSYLAVLKIDAKHEIKSLARGLKSFKVTENALILAWKDGLRGKTGQRIFK